MIDGKLTEQHEISFLKRQLAVSLNNLDFCLVLLERASMGDPTSDKFRAMCESMVGQLKRDIPAAKAALHPQ